MKKLWLIIVVLFTTLALVGCINDGADTDLPEVNEGDLIEVSLEETYELLQTMEMPEITGNIVAELKGSIKGVFEALLTESYFDGFDYKTDEPIYRSMDIYRKVDVDAEVDALLNVVLGETFNEFALYALLNKLEVKVSNTYTVDYDNGDTDNGTDNIEISASNTFVYMNKGLGYVQQNYTTKEGNKSVQYHSKEKVELDIISEEEYRKNIEEYKNQLEEGFKLPSFDEISEQMEAMEDLADFIKVYKDGNRYVIRYQLTKATLEQILEDVLAQFISLVDEEGENPTVNSFLNIITEAITDFEYDFRIEIVDKVLTSISMTFNAKVENFEYNIDDTNYIKIHGEIKDFGFVIRYNGKLSDFPKESDLETFELVDEISEPELGM